MQTVNIHAAKTQLSRLVEQAAAGEEIIIARAGRPLARLVPLMAPATGRKRVLGVLAGHARGVRGSVMRLLLDTHLLLRALGDPDRLDGETRGLIEDAGNDVLFSAASI